MTRPVRILGISGSLRRQSYNTALLRAAKALAGKDVELDVITLHGIPLYNGDVETGTGIPQAVVELKLRILNADGLLFATPEYNNGIPGVFKNAIDWLSRPAEGITALFADRPVAVFGASLGPYGTMTAQNAWLPVLRTLGSRQWAGGKLMLPRADHAFNESGELVDESARMQVRNFVAGYARYVRGVGHVADYLGDHEAAHATRVA